MRIVSTLFTIALTGCGSDIMILGSSSFTEDTGEIAEETEDTEIDSSAPVEDTGDVAETEDTDTDEPVDEIEEEELACPTYFNRDRNGQPVEVSDELSIKGIGWISYHVTDPDKAIDIPFWIKTAAPIECGGVNVTKVAWYMYVLGPLNELRVYQDGILFAVDENGLPLWRGSDFYKVSPSNHHELISTIGNYGYGFDGTEEAGALHIQGYHNPFTDPWFKTVPMTAEDGWQKFDFHIFLADRLPVNQVIALSVMVDYEVDGIAMSQVTVAAPFALYEP